MTRIALLTVLCLLVAAPPASAGVWPLGVPAPKIVTFATSCPDGSGGPCADPSRGVIYLPPGTSRFAIWHERGHIVDAWYMSVGERLRFQALTRLPGEWYQGTGGTAAGLRSPSERFADAYAACQMNLTPGENWTTAYGYNPTPRQHRRVCGFIERALRS